MQSFLDPAILFFMFGILAGSLKSNLEIPPQISRFLSLDLRHASPESNPSLCLSIPLCVRVAQLWR